MKFPCVFTVFLICLGLPSVVQFVRSGLDVPLGSFSLRESIRGYFLLWNEDRGGCSFDFSEGLQRYFAFFRAKLLKRSTSHVLVGKDDWLFYRGNDIFEDLMGFREYDEAEVAKWYREFEDKATLAREFNSKYFLVTIPNKSTIVREKLPWWAAESNRKSRYAAIREYAPINNSLSSIHLMEALEGMEMADVETYWFDDTHWSGYAFQRGLLEIFSKALDERRDGLREDVSECLSVAVSEWPGDLANMSRMAGLWPMKSKSQLVFTAPDDMRIAETPLDELVIFDSVPIEAMRPVAIERDSGTGTAIVFHDSFLMTAKPSDRKIDSFPAALPFRRSIHIWRRPSLGELQRILELEPSDIVIEERVERLLFSENNM